GTVNEETCAVTRFGVIFLSDSGVYLFDGNNAILISKQINQELLPLNLDEVDSYTAFYDPFSKRYFLFTPTGTWIYDLDYTRWYRRSMIAKAAGVLAEQFDKITWGELTGTWADQDNVWAEYS